ncbi:enoyl-CoA hydratase/isomerase family protein [Nocardioides aequoreus]|uniref:enoyl-CoA hydratase/isomerase family protein n=1 Tax=Nocardioides aequoreus TaxID=397278 RepID=UPI0004C45585|nr:enoyl-CoA hydratase/isomerase family protein [Nocardioides aequoreus]
MDVEYSCRDGIAHLELNRPDRLNAVSADLVEQLLAGLDRAAAEAAVIVLSGRGRAFCAGHDLKEPPPAETPLQTRTRLHRLQEVTRRVRSFPGIVVAAVHGYALGAGCEFALCCDLVVADETAQLGFPEVGVGLSVTGGISSLLPRVVGPARAKELLVLGERFGADRAAGLGLVNRVVPAGEHLDAAMQLARRIAERPPLSTSLAKRVVDRSVEAEIESAMAAEVDHALLTSLSGEGEAPREAFTR